MYFVKAAFWIFLILLLMPTSDKEKSDFYGAAGRVVSDLGSFCTRNPDVCNQTTAVYNMVVRKVRNTVQIIEDAISTSGGEGEHERGGDPRVRRGAMNDARIAPASDMHDTLRPDDRSPDWRGPGGV